MEDEWIREVRKGREGKVMEGEGDFVLCRRKKKNPEKSAPPPMTLAVCQCAASTLYWSDWGDSPRIERASMNGDNRSVVVAGSLYWPNGLTLDYAAARLYWVDARHHVIESANLDGTQRQTVLDRGQLLVAVLAAEVQHAFNGPGPTSSVKALILPACKWLAPFAANV